MNHAKMGEIVNYSQIIFGADIIDQFALASTREALSAHGFSYKRNTFPVLADTSDFVEVPGESPSSLAECLLWKLGKWNAYINFADNYHNDEAVARNNDTVFFAFARYLKDDQSLIYDQHVLRALCITDTTLSFSEMEKCRSVLIDGKGQWRSSGSGKESVACYELYSEHALRLISKGIDPRALDEFLIPLGQALKKIPAGIAFSYV